MWKNKLLIIRESELDEAGLEDTIEAGAEYVLSRFDDLGREGWEPWFEANMSDAEDDIIGVWYFKQWVTE